jgi:Flp pilus assembly protein TadB
MARFETNDSDTGYSDAPGTRALVKGSAALGVAVMLGLVSLIAASLGVLPALVLLLLAVPLGVWGSHKLKRNERQIRPDEPPPGKLVQ